MKVVLTLECTLQVVQTPEAQICARNSTLNEMIFLTSVRIQETMTIQVLYWVYPPHVYKSLLNKK